MKKLVILLELNPWIVRNGYWLYPLLIATTIILVISMIIRYINHNRYKYISCNGYISRGDEKSEEKTKFRKDVHVRIHKKTGMYYYQELNKTWHKLRKIHRDQIEKSMSNGTPEFDIPKRKNFKEKSKRIKKIQTGKEKISSVMQTA